MLLSFLLVGCGKTNFNSAIKKIKESSYFTNNEELTKDDISYRYDIDTTNISDLFVYYYITKDNCDIIIIAKPTNQDGIDSYNQLIKKYEDEWLSIVYDEVSAKKVNDHFSTTSNGYYIYIVSDNSSEIYNLIKQDL